MIDQLEPIALVLKNRLGRPTEVRVQCITFNDFHYFFLIPTADNQARQFSNSAEHFAYQLVTIADVDPSKSRFFHCDAPEGNFWQRWRVQWAGGSPVFERFEALSESSQNAFSNSILADGADFTLLLTETRLLA